MKYENIFIHIEMAKQFRKFAHDICSYSIDLIITEYLYWVSKGCAYMAKNKKTRGRLEPLYYSYEMVKMQIAITYIQWKYTVFQTFKYNFIEQVLFGIPIETDACGFMPAKGARVHLCYCNI